MSKTPSTAQKVGPGRTHVVSFRLLLEEVEEIAKCYPDRALTDVCRMLVRKGLGKPLTTAAGYADGFSRGLAEAQALVRAAFKKAGEAFRDMASEARKPREESRHW